MAEAEEKIMQNPLNRRPYASLDTNQEILCVCQEDTTGCSKIFMEVQTTLTMNYEM